MALTVASAVLLESGLRAITNSLTSGMPVSISRMELGSSANVEVPSNMTGAIPVALYNSTSNSIQIEQEHGVATFNIALGEEIGDFFIGNVVLFVVDPVSGLEEPFACLMFPEPVMKTASEANGGAVGETGNYLLVKLAIYLSTYQATATIELSPSVIASLPSIRSIDNLSEPALTAYPHQILLNTPETGRPSLLVGRGGDNQWWGFPISWAVSDYRFGTISGGYQGDAYINDRDYFFCGYFHLTRPADAEIIIGGVNWQNGSGAGVNTLFGGTWS